MRTKGNAAAAVDADKGFALLIDEHCVNRTGRGASAATVAEFFPDDHSAAFTRGKCSCRADSGTGWRIANQAVDSGEPGCQATGGLDANPRCFPGQALVKQPGASQRTGMTADTPVHARRCQNFHKIPIEFPWVKTWLYRGITKFYRDQNKEASDHVDRSKSRERRLPEQQTMFKPPGMGLQAPCCKQRSAFWLQVFGAVKRIEGFAIASPATVQKKKSKSS